MCKETFRGRPVVICDEDSKAFCFDLFTMIDLTFGPAHFMRTDEVCAYHFGELRKRLAELSCANECAEWVMVGLGEELPTDGCAAVPQGNARA